jgi:hypothetical protein
MRYRVDFKNGSGYISLDGAEYEKAVRLYEERGVRIRQCKDIHDEGVVIMGAPIFEDLTRNKSNEN